MKVNLTRQRGFYALLFYQLGNPVGLALGYFQYRKKEKGIISTTLNPLMGSSGNTKLRSTIDIFAVIATITEVATSLGFGILQINSGLETIFELPNNATMQLLITAVLLLLYLTSAMTGIDRGIKWLSNINLSLALALMIAMLVMGSTVFILNSMTLGIGDYLQKFLEMIFRFTPYQP